MSVEVAALNIESLRLRSKRHVYLSYGRCVALHACAAGCALAVVALAIALAVTLHSDTNDSSLPVALECRTGAVAADQGPVGSAAAAEVSLEGLLENFAADFQLTAVAALLQRYLAHGPDPDGRVVGLNAF